MTPNRRSSKYSAIMRLLIHCFHFVFEEEGEEEQQIILVRSTRVRSGAIAGLSILSFHPVCGRHLLLFSAKKLAWKCQTRSAKVILHQILLWCFSLISSEEETLKKYDPDLHPKIGSLQRRTRIPAQIIMWQLTVLTSQPDSFLLNIQDAAGRRIHATYYRPSWDLWIRRGSVRRCTYSSTVTFEWIPISRSYITKPFLQWPLHCEICGSSSIRICCFV